MKKLLAILGTISIVSLSTTTVIACGDPNVSTNDSDNDNNNDNNNDIDNDNDKPEVEDESVKKDKENTEAFENAANSKLIVDTKVEDEAKPSTRIDKDKILLEVSAKFKENLNLSSEYSVEVIEPESFSIPSITDYEDKILKSTSTIENGSIKFNLVKGNTVLSTKEVKWTTNAYETISSLVNLLTNNANGTGFDLILANIPILGTNFPITLGTIYNLFSLVSALSIVGGQDVVEAINWAQAVDFNVLADANTENKKQIYQNFEDDFESKFLTKIVSGLTSVLQAQGISTTFEIMGQSINISEILDLDLFSVLGLEELLAPIEISEEGKAVAKYKVIGSATISIYTGKEKNKMTLKGILMNIAPNIVSLVKFITNEDSFENKNFVLSLIQFLTKNMDDSLKKISDANYLKNETKNYGFIPETNFDSLVYNLLSNFNSDTRSKNNDIDNKHLSINLNLDINIDVNKVFLVLPNGYNADLKLNENMDKLLFYIQIKPTDILIEILNGFISFQAKEGTPNGISINENLVKISEFVKQKDIEIDGILKNYLSKELPTILSIFSSLFKGFITDAINPKIIEALPELSMKKLIDGSSKQLINSIIGDDVDLENSKIAIDEGIFRFEFYSEETNTETNEKVASWKTLNSGLDILKISNLLDLRLVFENVKFSGEYLSENGDNVKFETNNDLSFTINFSDNNYK